MNEEHIHEIFTHYIDKFEIINNSEHQEYYKWQIAMQFHDAMDIVLSAPKEEFPVKLGDIKKLTENLIDSYTQPLQGLVKISEYEQETETVRSMFLDLFSANPQDVDDKQKKIDKFLKMSHTLRDKYFPESYLYKDDMHSVTGYLFLYDPNNNYFFKASHALKFADCVEFYDDWGAGDLVNLATYYKMCDQLVERIKNCPELIETDASRFSNGWGEDPNTLHPDPNKHILAFDVIYCCSTYDLFTGITFDRPKTKERHLMQERKEKALLFADTLNEARENFKQLEDSKQYVDSQLAPGTHIVHKRFGEGIITDKDGGIITVSFFNYPDKSLSAYDLIAKGLISTDKNESEDELAKHRDILGKEELIKAKLTCAEKDFAKYSEYLD